jgi:hypothetical protein
MNSTPPYAAVFTGGPMCIRTVPLLVLVCAAALIVDPLTETPIGATEMDNAVITSVRASKTILHLGESLEIVASVKNVSPESLMVPGEPLNPLTHVIMETSDGSVLQSYMTKIADFFPKHQLDGYVELKPGAEMLVSFPASLREMTFPDISKGRGAPSLTGLFLDLKTAAIRIPRPGVYSVRFRYRHGRQLSDELEQYSGGRKVWHGETASDPVAIEVR